ncbi:MAG: N-acetylneuraminate synthase [Marinilabiliales bacterium]
MNNSFIIAEAGVNHNGSINTAKKMIEVAVKAGVNAIKFQTFKTENIVSKNAKKADYQIQNTGSNESQFDMIKKLELNEEQHLELITYCKKRNIEFLSSPFDLESIDLLNNLGLEIFKIPSGEITNYPYLQKIGALKKQVILSSGMSTLQEIENALKILLENGTNKENITVLHANTEYPTPMEDVNLKAMLTIRDKFNIKVGYSDHTLGIEVPIAAVALGACVIEKHFTLDRNMIGPDHKASLEPDELTNMVKAIRNIEIALGNGEKKPSKSELKNIAIARKSIHAKTNIKKGEIFTENNIIAKRPGDGISPMLWNQIIGKKAKKDFKSDEKIEI